MRWRARINTGTEQLEMFVQVSTFSSSLVQRRAKTNTGTEQLEVFVQCTAVRLTVFSSSSVQ